ncbi:hypothetical protein E4U60_002752 [Claviceps pazoutovae]|uniref:HTH CENPB-type domain-containing protein n=1 Tax=Claviceps pazoutovae TaxID=1649127 RepID=A0A9P7MBA3_9HYPO|nr:hypothetical protein E4U60_002752 [Claviceps pazoutovae]
MASDASDADCLSEIDFLPDADDSWIDLATGLPNFYRCTQHNLEERTIAAVELYRGGYYPSIMKAAAALEVPYYRVYGRSKGQRPISHTGGQRAVLTPAEDRALLIWAHHQVMCGHHIQIRRLRLQVNEMLRASGRNKKVTKRWARRYMSRHTHIFHVKKASTQEARRKAVGDCAIITSWFQAWRTYLSQYKPLKKNV